MFKQRSLLQSFFGELSNFEGLVLSVDHNFESVQVVQGGSLVSEFELFGERGLSPLFLNIESFGGLAEG